MQDQVAIPQLDCLAYSPQLEKDWIDLMAIVQAGSDAWEAVYLSHPNFAEALDFCFYLQKELIGLVAGHSVSTPENPKSYSVEVLALHPDFRGRGLAEEMMRISWNRLESPSQVSF